jgi:hypothetical protein
MGTERSSYYPEGRKAFYEAVQLLGDYFGETMSEEMISRFVAKEVTGLHKADRRDIEKRSIVAAHDLLENLKNCPNETVRINAPIYGMTLWPESFTVRAGSVTFYCIFSSSSSRVEEANWTRWLPQDDWKIVNLGLPEGKNFGGSLYWAKAIFRSKVKDYEYQRLEVTRLIREALALISLFINSLPENERHTAIPGLMLMDIYPVSRLSDERFVKEQVSNGKPVVFPFIGAYTDAYLLKLRNDIVAVCNSDGFQVCAGCLNTTGITELQHRVRRTLDYVALGLRTADRDRSQRFVVLMTALEALLLRREDEKGKAKKLSERVRLLLGGEYNVEFLYDLRSRIVHGDLSLGRNDLAIQRMEYILYRLISRMLNGSEGFTTLNQALSVSAGKVQSLEPVTS